MHKFPFISKTVRDRHRPD